MEKKYEMNQATAIKINYVQDFLLGLGELFMTHTRISLLVPDTRTRRPPSRLIIMLSTAFTNHQDHYKNDERVQLNTFFTIQKYLSDNGGPENLDGPAAAFFFFLI